MHEYRPATPWVCDSYNLWMPTVTHTFCSQKKNQSTVKVIAESPSSGRPSSSRSEWPSSERQMEWARWQPNEHDVDPRSWTILRARLAKFVNTMGQCPTIHRTPPVGCQTMDHGLAIQFQLQDARVAVSISCASWFSKFENHVRLKVLRLSF